MLFLVGEIGKVPPFWAAIGVIAIFGAVAWVLAFINRQAKLGSHDSDC